MIFGQAAVDVLVRHGVPDMRRRVTVSWGWMHALAGRSWLVIYIQRRESLHGLPVLSTNPPPGHDPMFCLFADARTISWPSGIGKCNNGQQRALKNFQTIVQFAACFLGMHRPADPLLVKQRNSGSPPSIPRASRARVPVLVRQFPIPTHLSPFFPVMSSDTAHCPNQQTPYPHTSRLVFLSYTPTRHIA